MTLPILLMIIKPTFTPTPSGLCPTVGSNVDPRSSSSVSVRSAAPGGTELQRPAPSSSKSPTLPHSDQAVVSARCSDPARVASIHSETLKLTQNNSNFADNCSPLGFRSLLYVPTALFAKSSSTLLIVSRRQVSFPNLAANVCSLSLRFSILFNSDSTTTSTANSLRITLTLQTIAL